MAGAIDFLRLYREFQLKPGADIDDLKRAYRRRVSLVHPDRLDARDAISQQLATEHLQRLTALYEAGVQFHRQHGRLPGASAVTDVHAMADRDVPEDRPVRPADAGKHGLRWAVIAVLLAAVLGWWLWPEDIEQTPAVIHAAPVARVSALGSRPGIPVSEQAGIMVGMRKESVLRIQGAPVMRDGERWLYGPSWILFREGKVAEWYSSPLHPLRVSAKPEK
ncbi:DnaJ family molecular chaperone [Dokdonella sp.]|uniref:DnaJ family molecular chaperone n=1 Tax=Dokdonella sp. TaxID=2291710 RepID=UPI0035288B35